MYQQVDSSLLGHVDLSEPTLLWKTLSICPTGLTNDQNTGKKLSVVGKGSELSFTVQIAEGASEIVLDEPHTVNVQGDQVSVFRFNPRQGISDKQLDITATSQSTVAAYLKVSQNCEEVDVQKDLESIDYKKESLRLSFATKGRITLSSVSIPPLTDSVSRWFIGIGLKNLSGDVKLSESKNVALLLTRSFGYNYATPICIIFFVSIVVGVLVSFFAYRIFEESLIQVKPGEVNANLVCEEEEVIRCREGYAFITCIVGVTLMVGASQYVFANRDTMIQEGDRDKCYYNDFCYRVANHDIPCNLMTSNLPYIVHGLILAVWVRMLERKVNLLCKSGGDAREAKAIKQWYSFSIPYALAWALVFQGLFSTLYHLCPGVYTFQFDSAFMFIIAGLIIVLSYNGIEWNRSQNEKYPVNAFYFFLFFITPLFVLNCVAARLYSYPGLNKIMKAFFYAFLVIWWSGMFFWAFYKLNMHQKCFSNNKFNAFLFILGGLVIPVVIFIFFWFRDPAQVFLLACIACSLVAILAKARFSKCKFGNRHGKGTLQVIFIVLTLIIFVGAIYVFGMLPTTDKTLSPENSRDLNEECVIFGFFDWHDLWHFLSSFGLLMDAFVVMFVSS